MAKTYTKLVSLKKQLQERVEFGQKKAVKKVGNKRKNLIHCSNSVSDSGVVQIDRSFISPSLVYYDRHENNMRE